MTSFYNGENHLLQTMCISEAMCEELEETKSCFFNEKVVMVACHGEPLGRFMRILLSEGSRCSYLNMGLMNRLPVESWARIGTGIRSSRSLQHLVIGFTDLPQNAMKGLATGLHQAPSLSQLHLNDMVWEEDDDNDLAVALSANQHLKVLSISGCSLKDDRVAMIVRAVQRHPTLEELRLSGNKFSQETSLALAEVLRQERSCLTKLYLDNERYQNNRGRAKLNFGIIAEALKDNTSLKTLDLSDNLMNDANFACIAQALIPGDDRTRHNQTLQKLVLARNRITDAGFAEFLEHYLPEIRGLQTLALWGNLMEDTSSRKSLRHTVTNNRDGMVLKNRVIRAVMELEDVELLKAVALPEQIPLGLWPRLLQRAQHIHNQKTQGTAKSADSVFLMLRGPMMMAALTR